MKDQLLKISEEAKSEIELAGDAKALGEINAKYFNKSGILSNIMRGMRDVPAQERPQIGALVNEVRAAIENRIAEKEAFFAKVELERKLKDEKVDITEPSKGEKTGALHPLTQVMNKLVEICVNMGFEEITGPEVESDYYNFEAMNIPKNHPSRDMQDSFYINENIVLRTQTSAVQARIMENAKPPFKVIVPGRTYRNDSDSTHSPVFHQIEGLVIDENVNMVDLKSMLNVLMKRLFGEESKIRFRPSYFPFTEPSIEVDVSCPSCKGSGCRLCKGTGFMEVLGAGIVNPKVLEISGIDSKKYRGFAFGLGVDRLAMIINSVPDLRTFFRNDIRFLKQVR